jgi:uncharacterized membrane protein YhaH (DUF805 family)
MDMMFVALKKYADFSGRAQRSEFWMFALLVFIIEAVFYTLMGVMGGMGVPGAMPSGAAGLIAIIFMVLMLGLLIPSIAVTFRRLHDTDRSAWWLLIAFVPIIGALVLLYFYIADGTAGPNKFGPDPKGRGAAEVFA